MRARHQRCKRTVRCGTGRGSSIAGALQKGALHARNSQRRDLHNVVGWSQRVAAVSAEGTAPSRRIFDSALSRASESPPPPVGGPRDRPHRGSGSKMGSILFFGRHGQSGAVQRLRLSRERGQQAIGGTLPISPAYSRTSPARNHMTIWSTGRAPQGEHQRATPQHLPIWGMPAMLASGCCHTTSSPSRKCCSDAPRPTSARGSNMLLLCRRWALSGARSGCVAWLRLIVLRRPLAQCSHILNLHSDHPCVSGLVCSSEDASALIQCDKRASCARTVVAFLLTHSASQIRDLAQTTLSHPAHSKAPPAPHSVLFVSVVPRSQLSSHGCCRSSPSCSASYFKYYYPPLVVCCALPLLLMLSSYPPPFFSWTMATFDRPANYWMNHLHHYTNDWQRSDSMAYEDNQVPFTSLVARDGIDVAKWNYDDETVAGDLEQYRQNLQDIADRISEELSGFEPQPHDRPIPSVETADTEASVAYEEKKQDVMEAASKLASKAKKSSKKKQPAPLAVPSKLIPQFGMGPVCTRKFPNRGGPVAEKP